MPERTRLRASTTDMRVEIQRLAASRKEPIGLVQQARIPAAADEGPELAATATGGLPDFLVDPSWIRCF